MNFFQATNVFVVDLTASGNDGQKTLSQDDKANASSPDLETLRLGDVAHDRSLQRYFCG